MGASLHSITRLACKSTDCGTVMPSALGGTSCPLERNAVIRHARIAYYADASLLWVADQMGITGILTIDLRDFAAYRLPNGKALVPVL